MSQQVKGVKGEGKSMGKNIASDGVPPGSGFNLLHRFPFRLGVVVMVATTRSWKSDALTQEASSSEAGKYEFRFQKIGNSVGIHGIFMGF